MTKLQGLQKQHLIEIADAAIVEWPKGKKRPKTRQVMNLTGAGALNGAFWSMPVSCLQQWGMPDGGWKAGQILATPGLDWAMFESNTPGAGSVQLDLSA